MRCIATPSTHNSGAGDADEAEGGGKGGGRRRRRRRRRRVLESRRERHGRMV